MGANVNKKVIKGVKWTSFQTVLTSLLGPLTIVLHARYLTPTEIGYVAIIMIVISLVSVIEDMGMSQAIIQNPNFNNQVFTSLFTVNIFLSILISIILYFLAPYIEKAFDLEGLSYYLQLIILIIIVQSPSLILRAVLQKELLIKPFAIIEIFKNLVRVITLILMLMLGYGVLSIVYSYILGHSISLILFIAYFLKNKIVKFSRFENVKGLLPYLKFGTIISVKQIFTTTVLKVDEIIIGLMLNPDVLGLYHFAKSVLERVRTILTSTFQRVLYPYFSKLQNNFKELNIVYNRFTKILAFIAFPVFTGLALTAQYFIPIVFGEEWLDSLVIFRIISIGLIPMLLTSGIAVSLLYSINKPGLVLKVDVITGVIYLIILYIVADFGVIFIALTYVLFILAKFIYFQINVNNALNGTYIRYLQNLKRPFINTLIMTIMIISLHTIIPELNNVVMLIISITTGVVCYILLTRFFDREFYDQILSKIKNNY